MIIHVYALVSISELRTGVLHRSGGGVTITGITDMYTYQRFRRYNEIDRGHNFDCVDCVFRRKPRSGSGRM